MVWEPARSADAHGRDAQRLSRHALEGREVLRVVEDLHSADTPIEDMKHHPSRSDSRDSGHGAILPTFGILVNICACPLYSPPELLIPCAPSRIEAQNIARRFRDYGKYYFTFLQAPGVEPTNNGMEQRMRFVASDRKITQGTRGKLGRRWCERIWTVLATCVQRGRSAFQFISRQPADDLPPRAKDLRRHPNDRSPERGRVHPQPLVFLLPVLLAPTAILREHQRRPCLQLPPGPACCELLWGMSVEPACSRLNHRGRCGMLFRWTMQSEIGKPRFP
jgi:hypothetical protein